MSAKSIVNKFRKFGLPVDGVAILRNDILTVGERTIDVHSCNYGYIRTSGRKRYSKGQQITGCDFLNNVTEDLFLVLIIDEGKKLDAYINAARQILDADSDVTILEIDVNKEAIQRSESIPASLNKIARISFQYTYQEVGKCDEGVCEYVADVECDVEPCESKSFCERVQECLPEPVDTDCTLDVGSGCCDYSVELPTFPVSYCITLPDQLPLNQFFSLNTGINFLELVGSGISINIDIENQATAQQIIDEIIAYIDNRTTYHVDGNTICIYGTTTLSANYVFAFSIDNSEESVCGLIQFSSNDFISQGINCNGVQSNETLSLYTFQVLINGTWTDVTDEVSNGTWSRTNVCDDIITEWRIIDSEENVVDSGDVTATCEESAQVTDSVCNWLQAHQTAIEQLQQGGGGGGLTCADLQDCEVIQNIEQRLTDIETELPDKANTADLAGLQTKAKVISASQTAVLDEVYTVVATSTFTDPTPAEGKGFIVMVRNGTATVGGTGYATAGTVIRRIFHSGSWVNYAYYTGVVPTLTSQLTNDSNYITLAQARAGAYSRFFADFGNTSVNTNTSNVVLGSVLIPANTFTGNAILEIESAISRAVSGANPGHRLFINTSNAFAGATQIASIGIGTTVLWSKGERSFKCAVGSLRGFSFTTTVAIDDTANTNAPSSTTPNWGVDQYILTVVNNATGETTTHEYTTVKVLTT